MELGEESEDLIAAAKAVRKRAYAPYSRFAVGAALRLRDGSLVTGVNVENASYGLTVCAERNAVAAAVHAGCGPGDILEIAIAAEVPKTIPPCGACRQVLAEFCVPSARVLMHRLPDDVTEVATMAELLPRSFTAKDLPKTS